MTYDLNNLIASYSLHNRVKTLWVITFIMFLLDY